LEGVIIIIFIDGIFIKRLSRLLVDNRFDGISTVFVFPFLDF